MKSIIRKIILATDFSESSEEASYHAVSLAQTFNAELQALHVFTPRPIGTNYATVQKEKQAKEDFVLTRERGEKMLNKLAKSFHVEGPTWSPNGRYLMYFKEERSGEDGSGGDSSLFMIDLTGFNERRIITPLGGSDPSWSPLMH